MLILYADSMLVLCYEIIDAKFVDISAYIDADSPLK